MKLTREETLRIMEETWDATPKRLTICRDMRDYTLHSVWIVIKEQS
jgi:hypothetical protein